MFTPRYLKQAKLLLRHTQKYLRYKSDVMQDTLREDIDSGMRRLQAALRQRDRKQIETRAEELDEKLHKLAPVTWESHWRENCEVILVAIVVAVGIRSYFLQPFKIPTGSMQPTLNGIIGHKHFYQDESEIPADQKRQYEFRDNGWYLNGYVKDAGPNIVRQLAEFVVRGRNYIDVVSRDSDQVLQVEQKKFLFFFTFSRIICRQHNYLVYAPWETLRDYWNISPGRIFQKGEVMARGAIDTGDQVFVDKFSYNFVKPHRGDVFVFRTQNIPGIPEDPQNGAPFYIKRLAGLPGDTLRIDPPRLFINDKPAEEIAYGFRRVIEAKPPYRGYSEGPLNIRELESQLEEIRSGKERAKKAGFNDRAAQFENTEQQLLERLESIKAKLTVPPHGYFAMGDNSYNSYDSRWWGPVPEENLVGRGLLVYWPFYPHWGLIR
jgi:signal peptidase I